MVIFTPFSQKYQSYCFISDPKKEPTFVKLNVFKNSSRFTPKPFTMNGFGVNPKQVKMNGSKNKTVQNERFPPQLTIYPKIVHNERFWGIFKTTSEQTNKRIFKFKNLKIQIQKFKNSNSKIANFKFVKQRILWGTQRILWGLIWVS